MQEIIARLVRALRSRRSAKGVVWIEIRRGGGRSLQAIAKGASWRSRRGEGQDEFKRRVARAASAKFAGVNLSVVLRDSDRPPLEPDADR